MQSTQIKTRIIDFENGKFSSKDDQAINLSEENSVTGLGQLISSKACRQMIEQRFEKELQRPSQFGSEIAAYDIGKEAVLMILLQSGCEGIRFIHCINDENKRSLVAIGIDNTRKPLKLESLSKERTLMNRSDDDPIIIEKIGEVTLDELFKANNNDQPLSGLQLQSLAIHLTDKFINLL